ncbi:MAG: UvrD-helicase domain-containing protein [Deltaproteobacteria bacterium]|nr:UvrD-helicase domain-containing protein [Deltaproteobacteria bacterium]
MSRWLRKLNAEQKRAVRHVNGPLLVLAGAGSGKTRVITHRVAYLIEQGVAPDNILAVTFTNKAAGEMRERLRQMIGEHADNVTMSTFHALGLMMLKTEAAQKKRRSRFSIFDTGDQLACLREITGRVHLDRSFDLGSVLARISAMKTSFVPPDACDTDSADPYDQAAELLYPLYAEALEAFAAVDFDDLVCKPTLMMEHSADCRARWADRFRYLLVDEYQDTNTAQLRMLKALCPHQNICVVGDDDQSIYGWRGAEVRNILEFDKHFPGAKTVFLLNNYRSTQPILRVANMVIAENKDRHEKALQPVRNDDGRVSLRVFPDADSEASWLGKFLFETIKSERYQADQIAVLYRSNTVHKALEPVLREHGIDYRVLGGTALFERKEVKDVIAYLRLTSNPADEISLRRVINVPARGIGPKTVSRLADYAEQHGLSLYKALKQAAIALGASDRALGPIGDFLTLLDDGRRQLRAGGQVGHQAQAFIEKTGLRAEIERTTPSAKIVERRLGNIGALLRGLVSYADRASKPSLGEYLNLISLATADEDADGAKDKRITLSTLHGCKGLEFPLVVIVGLEDGLLPHDRTLNPQANDHMTTGIDEERRLFYVGITRAMDELIITRAATRAVRGRVQERPASRFLCSIPEELITVDDLTAAPSMDQVRSMLSSLRDQWGAEGASLGPDKERQAEGDRRQQA